MRYQKGIIFWKTVEKGLEEGSIEGAIIAKT